MEINLTTPALLFPAISLLLLAYTNRFLSLAALIRDLHSKYQANPDDVLLGQLANLRYRVRLIKSMQAYGVMSIFCCVLCMLVLFAGWIKVGEVVFIVSLVLMMISLAISAREIQVSVGALDLHLRDLESNLPKSSSPNKSL